MSRAIRWLAGAVSTFGLVACGGGSSESASSVGMPGVLTIAGSALKGAALAGATVTAKCAVGSGSALTAADGSYTLTLVGASLPCALKVVGTEGSVFHSVLPGTADRGSYVVNLTPLTELLVAKVGGTMPETYFAGFGAASAVPESAVSEGNDYLKVALEGVTDLTGVNAVSDTFKVGDARDRKLDELTAAVAAAGSRLAEVAARIVANPASPREVGAPLIRPGKPG
ncbi:MAG: hypothetical protein ABIX46_02530 [Burkholderiaceae bacterium]